MANGGRLLHDEAGPLLSAAGFKLEILKLDHPAVARDLGEVLDLLDKAMEHIRKVSQQLNPSPAARSGLKQALLGLVRPEPDVSVSYTVSAQVPVDMGPRLYEIAAAAVGAAIDAGASRIRVAATGSSSIRIRITDDGRKPGRARALAPATLLARAAGISLDIVTKRDTIVSIVYGLRRTTGR
jgi:signal transduction histidine kinase